MLLPKTGDLAVARFAAPSRAQLYTLDGAPAWLDARAGRPDDLSPTVTAVLHPCGQRASPAMQPLHLSRVSLPKSSEYGSSTSDTPNHVGRNACLYNIAAFAQVLTLWRAPDLLPRVMCRHADVSHFLIGVAPPRSRSRACMCNC